MCFPSANKLLGSPGFEDILRASSSTFDWTFGNTAVAKPTLCYFAASFCFLPSLVLFAQFSSFFLLPFFTLVFFGFLLLSRSVFTTINSFVLKTCLYLFPTIQRLSRLVNHFSFLPIRINKFSNSFPQLHILISLPVANSDKKFSNSFPQLHIL